MTPEQNAYAEILLTKKILYMPSCVVVEMMAKLYSQIFAINKAGVMNGSVPELLRLLRRMRANLRATAEAYGNAHIRFFVSEWKDDRLRARKIVINTMAHLRFLAGMIAYEERGQIQEAIEGMTSAWTELDRVMDAKAGRKNSDTVCRYFCNRAPENWKVAMANNVLTLEEDEGNQAEDSGCLVLICFGKIKRSLVTAIEAIERRQGHPGRFNPDRILAVSDEDVLFSCPTCLEMAGSVGKQVEYSEAAYADALLGLRGATCAIRPRFRQVARGEVPKKAKKRHTTMQWLREALGLKVKEPAGV